MTKDEFLTRMERSLTVLAPHERIDILSDYVEHFREGEENGKTDEEIAEALGNPEELAKTFLEEKGMDPQATQRAQAAQNASYSGQGGPVPPYRQPGQPYSGASSYGQQGRPFYTSPAAQTGGWAQSAYPNNNNQMVATILVVLFNIFIGVPLILSICGGMLAVPATAVGLLIASVALFAVSAAFAGTAIMIAGILCLGVAALALSVLLGVATAALIKLVIKLIKWYIDFCVRICREGRWPVKEGAAA